VGGRSNRVAAQETSSPRWRLIVTPPSGGAWNMGCDHALAESVGRGGPPVLRLYGWRPAAVSVGWHQPLEAVRGRLEHLRAKGIEAVRRPTGGAAVLHAEEVTYSVAAPVSLPALGGRASRACALIHEALREGLASLGIGHLELSPAGSGGATAAAGRSPHCFALPSRFEIAWHGRKLVGSAQRRLEGSLLQHGSVPLAGDQSALEELWPDAPAPTRTASLREAAGRPLMEEEVRAALRRGFERALGIAFLEDALRPEEEARAAELERVRYSEPAYLLRV
jgi:lipoate-protein ligase A